MILLTVAYVFNFVDRYILSLLVEPIKADLDLSDAQMGLLIGFAFALLYGLAGLPLGWLADRGRRTLLLGTGIALWSLATAAHALAKNFSQLFLARVGVGVGEATLNPCALSMISDSFPPERRGRPVAFFTGAQSIGAGLAFLSGGLILVWANSIEVLTLPLVGAVKPWQFTFVVVGLPGVLLALLLYLTREPARQERSAAESGASISQTLFYLWQRRGTYLSFVAFPLVMTTVAYSQNFFPSMYLRTWDWPIEKYALFAGTALLIVGPVTVNTAGWICDRLLRAGQADGPMRVMFFGSVLLVVFGIASPLMPTGELAFALWLLNLVGMSTVSASSPIALLNIAPSTMRGQCTALFYMITSLGGLVIGPSAVGWLSSNVFGESALYLATATVPAAFGLPALLLLGYARRRYLAEAAAITAARSGSAINPRTG